MLGRKFAISNISWLSKTRRMYRGFWEFCFLLQSGFFPFFFINLTSFIVLVYRCRAISRRLTISSINDFLQLSSSFAIRILNTSTGDQTCYRAFLLRTVLNPFLFSFYSILFRFYSTILPSSFLKSTFTLLSTVLLVLFNDSLRFTIHTAVHTGTWRAYHFNIRIFSVGFFVDTLFSLRLFFV